MPTAEVGVTPAAVNRAQYVVTFVGRPPLTAVLCQRRRCRRARRDLTSFYTPQRTPKANRKLVAESIQSVADPSLFPLGGPALLSSPALTVAERQRRDKVTAAAVTAFAGIAPRHETMIRRGTARHFLRVPRLGNTMPRGFNRDGTLEPVGTINDSDGLHQPFAG